MSNYNNRNSKKKRSRREKVGFYTASSICLVAVFMAVYSTYNTLSSQQIPQKEPNPTVQVNNYATGITEPVQTQPPTSMAEITTKPIVTEAESTEADKQKPSDDRTALETMLSADVNLTCPLSSSNIIRPYSEDTVYFKLLNVWKPHTGADFAGKLGDDVKAMSAGTVSKIREDKLYGKTVEVSTNNAVCIYSGLGDVSVSEGDNVDVLQKLGTIGAVPMEAGDEAHIHVSVKIDDKYADPLSLIGNNQ